MQKAAHFPLVVAFEGDLLEAADAEHVAQKPDLLLSGKLPVDLGFGESWRIGESWHGSEKPYHKTGVCVFVRWVLEIRSMNLSGCAKACGNTPREPRVAAVH